MQVALIAWEQLTPAERAKVVAVLKAHPRFKEDFVPPETVAAKGQALIDKWIFAHAATWPDIARKFEGELGARFHRWAWHFINHPVFLSVDEEEAMHDKVPPSVNIEHKLPANPDESKLNVVQAMKLCVLRINAANATVEDKALYLSWLFHLVGDVHQPLHGVALFSRQTFPEGDRGGNSLKTTTGQKLHGAWDGTLGPGSSLAFTAKRAHQYLKDEELRAAGEAAAKVQLFKAWVEESYEAAIEAVYTPEILIVLQQNEQKTTPVKEPTIPTSAEYFDRARETARTRAVEAGYRLAEMIRAQLKL